ncbi:MAG TPA: prepilin-type N-terminal cleavage/methylation domain-containing protein [Pseudomonadaceae bacterium]|nr:prepilin-type N-terminal cleavage/methylation domain-containing protein [Pseudomonadaceae bacterium]
MHSEQRGFTLVEMMIALVVLSLISLGTLSAMRTMAMTQERLTATTDRVDELRQVSQFLRASLRQARVPPSSGFGGTWGGSTAGPALAQHHEVVWLAPFELAGGASGLNHLRVYPDGDNLRIQFQPHRQEFDQTSWSGLEAGEILVKNLEEFAVYYRLVNNGPWVEEIIEEDMVDGLPAAIRLVVKSGGRYWPEIVVSPDQGGNRL